MLNWLDLVVGRAITPGQSFWDSGTAQPTVNLAGKAPRKHACSTHIASFNGGRAGTKSTMETRLCEYPTTVGRVGREDWERG